MVVIDLNREKFVEKALNGTFASKRLRFVSALNQLPLVGKQILSMALFSVRLREGGSEILVLCRKPQEKTGAC